MSVLISNPSQSIGLELKTSENKTVIKMIPAGSKFLVDELTVQMEQLKKIGLLNVRKATGKELLSVKMLSLKGAK